MSFQMKILSQKSCLLSWKEKKAERAPNQLHLKISRFFVASVFGRQRNARKIAANRKNSKHHPNLGQDSKLLTFSRKKSFRKERYLALKIRVIPIIITRNTQRISCLLSKVTIIVIFAS